MKAGIIGLGHGSRVVIESFKLSKIYIYGIASKNFNKSKIIGKNKKIANVFHDWKLLIQDQNIDIVAIAVPPNIQLEIIKECIKENKIILCEKPFGTNIRAINNTLFKLSRYNKSFLVNYIFTEHNAFVKFKKIIDKRKLKTTDRVYVNFITETYVNKYNIDSWKNSQHKGGGIINLFMSHLIDYLVIFFGKIDKIYCKIERFRNREISLKCNLRFFSNLNASINIETNNPKVEHSINFFSEKYQLSLKNYSKDYCKNFKLKQITNYKNKKVTKEILFNNDLSKFNNDSRIVLTSKLINKLKKKDMKYSIKKYCQRIKYNEYILNQCRLSAKKNIN